MPWLASHMRGRTCPALLARMHTSISMFEQPNICKLQQQLNACDRTCLALESSPKPDCLLKSREHACKDPILSTITQKEVLVTDNGCT